MTLQKHQINCMFFSNYLLYKFKPGFKRKLRIKKRTYALCRYLSTVDFLSDYHNTGKTLKPQNITHFSLLKL